jgi:hypothetical protein
VTGESDILERLRQEPSSDLQQEAADEIERLRAALAIARKNARTDADATATTWAEGTITYMRKLLEQQTVTIQRHNDEIKRLRGANERLRKTLIETLRAALSGLVAYLDGQAYRNYEQERELLKAARAALKGQ